MCFFRNTAARVRDVFRTLTNNCGNSFYENSKCKAMGKLFAKCSIIDISKDLNTLLVVILQNSFTEKLRNIHNETYVVKCF